MFSRTYYVNFHIHLRRVFKMMKKIVVCLGLALFVGGCTNNLSSGDKTYKDGTLVVSDTTFALTVEGKAVETGSVVFAMSKGCQLIQRYQVTTNVRFEPTLNLLKNRAALMGANFVGVVFSSEIDTHEDGFKLLDEISFVQSGTSMGSSRFLQQMIGDLYECL